MKRVKGVLSRQIVGLIVCLLVLTIGFSYAWYNLTLNGTKESKLVVGTLSLNLDEKSEKGITINNAEPVTDEIGIRYTPYTFSVTNTGNLDSNYSIYLDDLDIDSGKLRLDDKYVKYSLVKDDEIVATRLLSDITGEKRVLDTGSLLSGQTVNYKLKLWVDVNTPNEEQNKVFSSQIRIEGV